MDLVTLYLAKRIGNLEEKDWELILAGSHDTLSIKKTGQGMLMLNNNTIIKCVSNYYRKPTADPKQKVKHSNAALQCHFIQETLDIVGVDVYQCAHCHQRCLAKRRRRELVRNSVVK